jgi:hypothetical protein
VQQYKQIGVKTENKKVVPNGIYLWNFVKTSLQGGSRERDME